MSSLTPIKGRRWNIFWLICKITSVDRQKKCRARNAVIAEQDEIGCHPHTVKDDLKFLEDLGWISIHYRAGHREISVTRLGAIQYVRKMAQIRKRERQASNLGKRKKPVVKTQPSRRQTWAGPGEKPGTPGERPGPLCTPTTPKQTPIVPEWDRAMKKLMQRIPAVFLETVIMPLSPRKDGDRLLLHPPDKRTQLMVQERYMGLISETLKGEGIHSVTLA